MDLAPKFTGAVEDNGRPGFRVVEGPSAPADEDLAHALACLRASIGLHVEPRSIQAAMRAATWRDLANSILDCAPDIRAAWPDRWLSLLSMKRPEQADAMRHALEVARGLIVTEPDEPSTEPEAPEEPEGFRLKPMGALEFLSQSYRMQWAVKHILVRDQPAVIAGPKKTLKTSVLVDLGVSLASGTPFLGQFAVDDPLSVLILSGESGGPTLLETVKRVLDAKRLSGNAIEGRFFIDQQLPQLSNREHLDELARTIEYVGAQVAVIDPLYLCLLSSAPGQRIDASNLFDMGPLFQSVARTCLDLNCTPVLVHHFRNTGVDSYAPPEMDSMAFAGIREFARQWILLGRRQRYEPGSGKHELWLSVGGSAGHSGEWAVDVDEGQLSDDFTGRRWEVEVKYASEARTEAVDDRKAEAEAKAVERQALADAAAEQQLAGDVTRVLDAIRELNVRGEPTTANRIQGQSHLNPSRTKAALARALTDSRLFRQTGPRPAGATGPKAIEFYTLAAAPAGGAND